MDLNLLSKLEVLSAAPLFSIPEATASLDSTDVSDWVPH
jgi:hypothetical protein